MRADPGALASALAELASLSAEPFDVSEFVHLATDRACEVLDSDGAIVLLSVDGFAMQPAGSSGSVGDIAALLANEGVPCRLAMQTGTVVRFVGENGNEQFPEYASLASDAGIHRVLSIPLRHREGLFGTLSMVRLSPRDYTDEDITAAERLADVLAASIVREQVLREALAVTAQLQHALEARVVIEQAKGMVAAERRLSIDQALDCLRSFARSRQLRLADVAADIVSRELAIDALAT